MRRTLALVVVLVATTACGAQLGDPPATPNPAGGGGDDGGGGGGTTESGPDAGTGVESEPDASSSSDLAVSDFIAGELGGYCAEAFSCKSSFPATSSTGTFADNFGSSVSDCTTGYEDSLGASHVPGDLTNGKITYDADAAAACLAGIAYGTCASFWSTGGTYPAACSTALVGSVASGGACNSAYECADADQLCPSHVCATPAN